MIDVARIKVISDDRPRRVGHGGEGSLAHDCTCARGVKGCEAAMLIPHQAVIHIARVNVISRNRPHWVDARAECALECACTRAWPIERGDRAVGSADVPVIDVEVPVYLRGNFLI